MGLRIGHGNLFLSHPIFGGVAPCPAPAIRPPQTPPMPVPRACPIPRWITGLPTPQGRGQPLRGAPVPHAPACLRPDALRLPEHPFKDFPLNNQGNRLVPPFPLASLEAFRMVGVGEQGKLRPTAQGVQLGAFPRRSGRSRAEPQGRWSRRCTITAVFMSSPHPSPGHGLIASRWHCGGIPL